MSKLKFIVMEDMKKVFSDRDDPGNYICTSIGVDTDNNIIASKYRCEKNGCNCLGQWTNGSEDEVDEWILRQE